jgi:acyl-[acyl-carrier-protein]-phospholipid O-acyltransferase/long-chain-fatty-acid--[acyl-carrier-protein] ligase
VILLVLSEPLSESQRNTHVALAGALFAAPFILFSMLGGWLADRYRKQAVMARVKLSEVGIMLLAACGFGLHSLPLQFFSIFLMGCHSAIFAPSKYSILPEILPLEKLSWGNGVLELLTFLGIILGTVAGGLLATHFRGQAVYAGILLAALAILGWLLCGGVPRGIAANPTCPPRINVFTDFWRQLSLMRSHRDLWRANLGNAGFFFVAALLQMNLVLFGQGVLKLNESRIGLLNAALAIGIGIGSVIAGYASFGRINYRLVPLGASLMSCATIPMGMHGTPPAVFYASLVILGLGGGFFIVPITAVLQHAPSVENKGAVQGTASVLSFIGILGASGVQVVLSKYLHFESARVFWVCGITALISGIYVAFSRRGNAEVRL